MSVTRRSGSDFTFERQRCWSGTVALEGDSLLFRRTLRTGESKLGKPSAVHLRMVSGPARTPDGRYIVVIGKAGARLWRASNPDLPEAERQKWVNRLMDARRAVGAARGDAQALAVARKAVDDAKRSLGERGPPWWDDGAPDLNRHLVKNSPYRDWWTSISGD